jgi:hypothetical protein
MAKLQLLADSILTMPEWVAAPSSADTAFPGYNLRDWHSWSKWKAATAATSHTIIIADTVGAAGTATANALGLYGHDLAGDPTAQLVLEGGTDPSGSTWTTIATIRYRDVAGHLWLDDAQAVLTTFPLQTWTAWRLTLTRATPWIPYLAVVALGRRIDTERSVHTGMMNPQQARSVEVLNLNSDAGQFLGRSVIDRGVTGAAELEHLSPAWVEQRWMPFLMHANRHPFFLAWPPVAEGTVARCVFAWSDGPLEPPTWMSGIHLKAALKWKGRT